MIKVEIKCSGYGASKRETVTLTRDEIELAAIAKLRETDASPTMQAIEGSLHCLVGQCEDCNGKGWYGDNGPSIPGNGEFVRCDCGTAMKCTAGWHKYRVIDGIAWCDECGLEADLSVCKLTHPMPNASLETHENQNGGQP